MCLSDLGSFEFFTASLFPKRVRLSNKTKTGFEVTASSCRFAQVLLRGRKCNRCSASKFLLQLLQLLSTSSFQCSTGPNRRRQGLLTRPTAALTASKSTTGGTAATACQVHTPHRPNFTWHCNHPFPWESSCAPAGTFCTSADRNTWPQQLQAKFSHPFFGTTHMLYSRCVCDQGTPSIKFT